LLITTYGKKADLRGKALHKILMANSSLLAPVSRIFCHRKECIKVTRALYSHGVNQNGTINAGITTVVKH
jgi:hypothetical protein